MIKYRAYICGVLSALSSLLPAPAQAQRIIVPPIRLVPYTVQDLGVVSNTAPLGCIGNNGQFFGTRKNAATGQVNRPFTPGSQGNDFYLFNQAGIPSWIDGCNGNSEAVGFNQTAAIWDIQWTGPQRLPGGIGAFGISAEALAINSARQVAGYVVGAIAERPLLSAALWQTSSIPNNATTTTTLLASNAAARGINDAGEVVGECYAGISTDPRACDFSAGAHTRRNFPVSTRSSAADINTAGRVTGYRDTASGTRGFHWFPATGELVDLPPITSLFTVRYRNAEALALNDAGVTVGASWDDGGQHRATIWLGDGRPVEERRWLAAPRFSLQIATSHPSHVPGRQYQPCAPNPAPLEPRHIPVRKQPSARRGNGHSDHARPRTRAETKSDAPPAVPIHHLVV